MVHRKIMEKVLVLGQETNKFMINRNQEVLEFLSIIVEAVKKVRNLFK